MVVSSRRPSMSNDVRLQAASQMRRQDSTVDFTSLRAILPSKCPEKSFSLSLSTFFVSLSLSLSLSLSFSLIRFLLPNDRPACKLELSMPGTVIILSIIGTDGGASSLLSNEPRSRHCVVARPVADRAGPCGMFYVSIESTRSD